MLKWIAFAVGSLVWAAVCWFFASMVALSHAGPKASIAQDACANRIMIETGSTDRMAALYDPRCKAEHDRVMDEESRPILRKGLLIAFGPVLLLGFVLYRMR